MDMTSRTSAVVLLWAVLIAFFAWDWTHSSPVNHRKEPAILAIGSGQAPSGGHCSAF
ncbi:hypothetical protein GCM10009097_23040 [Pigmentiphaga daeguensis]|jgi:hypothetical protein|uniref:Uncharacterized protein n=2 Tax=Alcaligenaceae TaxID=506 RepID=A0ABP3LQI7_9BURK